MDRKPEKPGYWHARGVWPSERLVRGSRVVSRDCVRAWKASPVPKGQGPENGLALVKINKYLLVFGVCINEGEWVNKKAGNSGQ